MKKFIDEKNKGGGGARCINTPDNGQISYNTTVEIERKKFELTAFTLYVVATPIGNMGDITFRAVDTLSGVDFILTEDTRSAGRLMKRLGIKGIFESYEKFSESGKLKSVITRLKSGMTCALISESGTPLISDPGSRLVAACIEGNIRVEVIPGPSAVITAMVLSGFLDGGFHFAGFLPRKKSDREKTLNYIASILEPVVIFESPRRVHKIFSELAAINPERKAALVREMTKLYEQVIRGTCASLAGDLAKRELKGECVIVLGPLDESPLFDKEKTDMLYICFNVLKLEGIPPGKAAKITAKLMGLSGREAYKILLTDSEER
ncbi:MAG: 16S rRNA (cytidine(1402)-2'-O)-methyltransferase [Candidatus Marinimicrobia bacterium]|nr:16S rRNA (cytidine(1402)-2'-O)-methyltransferase [Candidatus Neomarinimicrobiota bacterium]